MFGLCEVGPERRLANKDLIPICRAHHSLSQIDPGSSDVIAIYVRNQVIHIRVYSDADLEFPLLIFRGRIMFLDSVNDGKTGADMYVIGCIYIQERETDPVARRQENPRIGVNFICGNGVKHDTIKNAYYFRLRLDAQIVREADNVKEKRTSQGLSPSPASLDGLLLTDSVEEVG